jgi:PAB-dependent poly(A)-specific ribonuclease subunit 2
LFSFCTSQIYDTVELYHLPGQRFLSLKFLATHVLGMRIQTDNHDAIEDARTALALYHKYVQLVQEGAFDAVLQGLYALGHSSNWKV